MRKSLTAVAAVVVAIVAMMAAVSHASAANAAAGCRVDYVVTSQWTGGFHADVAVTNLGEPVNGWTLRFAFPAVDQQFAQGWSATWAQSGQQVSATNLNWNATLGTNGAANIGFVGAWFGSNPVPAAFTLNGVACTGGVLPSRTTAGPTTSPPVADYPAYVNWVSPTVGAVYTAPGPVPLAATATVGGGHYITGVSFRVNGVTVAQGVRTTGDRFDAQWTPPTGAPGSSTTYVLNVSAGTDQSLSGGAPPLLVTVVTPPSSGTNHPPAVALSTPGGQTYFLEPTTVTLVADATDADAGDPVSRVELYLGTTKLAVTPTNSGQRYQFQVPLSAGTSSTFTVRVHDSHGGVGISNPLTFTIR
ncbi:cellulose binding domain-containing protein [Micromonospora sp. RL09-050-HVF-A]|uniref:cellulose binding domain-containing protein n=1 Tax=Micromonospora sp. RL09-050-HVF-A TaxID=1703433 RepID=UPI001C604E5D|nr:cellulose binding domain-containing protein [Micromonospora sp. RL09-050-HVF-A]MBW4701906.1 cellulose binding domain-containing protein [Micromonospora sp. RL09-050-HVF-A]